MTSIMTFQSKYGPVHIEVDESVAETAAKGEQSAGNTWVAKGVTTLSSRDGDEIHIESDTQFTQAIGSLKAYAATLLDVVRDIDLTPSEVAVEVGLKLTGSAGFIIAKAEGEANMKVSLKWAPGQLPDTKKEDGQ